MATDLEKLMLTHYTDNQIHVTPEQRYLLDQGIGDLIDGYTVIQSDLAQVDTILANAIASESIYADFIDTNLLEADKVLAAAIEATYMYSRHIDVEVANVISLFANYATIENLTAQRAEINVILTDYLRADSIIVNDLSAHKLLADVADIRNLLSFSISAQGIASIQITSDQLTVADGFINDAMIMDLSANKIKTGSIYTNLVDILSESGNLSIVDNTIQIKDSASTPRVQIGKDANADYNMYVWDVDGNLMFDATGIHAEGIKQPIIRDDMVSDTANISGSKLDIESVVTQINDGTTTLKSNKIYFDDEEQTLDVKLNSLTSITTDTQTNIDEVTDYVATLSTDMTIANGNISSIISATELEALDAEGITFYQKHSAAVQNLENFRVELTDLTTNFSSTSEDFDTRIVDQQASLNLVVDEISTKVSKSEYDTKTESLDASYVELKQDYDSFKTTVQVGGGDNLIKNSVGYGGFNYWDAYGIEDVVLAGTNLVLKSSVVKRFTWERFEGMTWEEIIT